MFDIHRAPAALDGAVLFAISVFVFLIFFATPGVDPARPLAGRNPTPETLKGSGTVRSRPAAADPVRDHDEEAVRYAATWVVHQPGSAGGAGDRLRSADHDLTRLRRRGDLVGGGDRDGVAAAVQRGTIWDPFLMVLALIGISIPVFWLAEVANLVTQSRYHDTFLFSWVPPLGYIPIT